MTKYVVEWTCVSGVTDSIETFSKGNAFKMAWQLKYDDKVAKVNVYETHTYCFKNEEV